MPLHIVHSQCSTLRSVIKGLSSFPPESTNHFHTSENFVTQDHPYTTATDNPAQDLNMDGPAPNLNMSKRTHGEVNSTLSNPQCSASQPAPSTRRAFRLPPSGLRNLFDHSNTRAQPQAHASAHQTQVPKISNVAKAFVDSLNTQQLSEFLIWMLYYDIVELPVSPDAWYSTINPMQMRGWIALGDYLVETSKALDTSHGMDLVVLDSICDRINLQRSTVHSLLIQFADTEKMAFSQISTTIRKAADQNLSSVESLEAVQGKLHELNKLVVRLQPGEDSMYKVWQAIISKRLRGLLHLVIGPRIANLRSGTPLVTAGTSDNLPKEITDGIKLNYMYEATLLKRTIPLARYGIHIATEFDGSQSPASSLYNASDSYSQDTQEIERARNHAIYLMAENQELRAQIARLQADKQNLEHSNEELELKFAKQNLF